MSSTGGRSGTAIATARSGTRAQRKLLTFQVVTQYIETDTRLALVYFPGVGWRKAGDGSDPDAPVAPVDTGVY